MLVNRDVPRISLGNDERVLWQGNPDQWQYYCRFKLPFYGCLALAVAAACLYIAAYAVWMRAVSALVPLVVIVAICCSVAVAIGMAAGWYETSHIQYIVTNLRALIYGTGVGPDNEEIEIPAIAFQQASLVAYGNWYGTIYFGGKQHGQFLACIPDAHAAYEILKTVYAEISVTGEPSVISQDWITDPLSRNLKHGERFLWTGVPDVTSCTAEKNRQDCLMALVVVVVLAVGLSLISRMGQTPKTARSVRGSIALITLGIGIPALLLNRRQNANTARNTRYAVTNRRVMVYIPSGILNSPLVSMDLSGLTAYLADERGGLGAVRFGCQRSTVSFEGALDDLPDGSFSFNHIRDAAHVKQLIDAAKSRIPFEVDI